MRAMNQKIELTGRRILVVGLLILLPSAYFCGTERTQDRVLLPAGGKVSYVVGPGAGNIGVQAGEDGILMVDDQFLPGAPGVDAAIAELGRGAPVFLINTHWHDDHTGANVHFGRTATIFAHDNVRRRLTRDAGVGGRVADKETPRVGLPTVTYEGGLALHFNGEEIRLLHVPGAHTDGDTVVWFTGSGVVHMGDLFFAQGYPFIDLDSGGDAEGLIAGLRSVLEWLPADAKVLPGHGPLTDVQALSEYTEMLATIMERVRELAAEDFSVDEMLEAGVSEEFDAQWGNGFIKPRRLVESLLGSLAD